MRFSTLNSDVLVNKAIKNNPEITGFTTTNLYVAYHAGKTAYIHNISRVNNPFDERDDLALYKAWERGWLEEMRDYGEIQKHTQRRTP